jgi:hypothetical protein
MSPEKKPKGYRPTEEPGPARLNMTVDEMHSMLERFKKLFEDSALARYIIWAGWFALGTFVLEAIRLVWLSARYLWKF